MISQQPSPPPPPPYRRLRSRSVAQRRNDVVLKEQEFAGTGGGGGHVRTLLLSLCCTAVVIMVYVTLMKVNETVKEKMKKVDVALQTSVEFMQEGIRTLKTIESASRNVSEAGQGIAVAIGKLSADMHGTLLKIGVAADEAMQVPETPSWEGTASNVRSRAARAPTLLLDQKAQASRVSETVGDAVQAATVPDPVKSQAADETTTSSQRQQSSASPPSLAAGSVNPDLEIQRSLLGSRRAVVSEPRRSGLLSSFLP